MPLKNENCLVDSPREKGAARRGVLCRFKGCRMRKPFWETTYRDLDAESFGDASDEVLELVSSLAPAGKVLDIGCGEGRNAIPLSRAGFEVTAIDLSEAGIEKLNHIARREGLEIRTAVADMTTYKFEDTYDLIIAHGCLHLIPRAQWETVIERMKNHTAPNGFNVVTVFTDEIAAPSDLADVCVGLFPDGELFRCYAGWHKRLEKSYTFHDAHPGNIEHLHAANKLVAQNCPPRSSRIPPPDGRSQH